MITTQEIQTPRKTRRVAIARGRIKEDLKRHNTDLATTLGGQIHRSVHGFVRNRSAITNALMHVGYKWSASMDIEDAFNSTPLEWVDTSHPSVADVVSILNQHGVTTCMQGLSVSPFLFNLAMRPIDFLCDETVAECNAVYSRYADDVTVSANSREDLMAAVAEVRKAWADRGICEQKQKFRIMSAKYGRRVICGVSVGDWDNPVSASRSIRRKVRAGRWKKHKMNRTEWGRFHGQDGWVRHVDNWEAALSKCVGSEFLCRMIWSGMVPMRDALPGWRGARRTERDVLRQCERAVFGIEIPPLVAMREKCPRTVKRYVIAWKMSGSDKSFAKWWGEVAG